MDAIIRIRFMYTRGDANLYGLDDQVISNGGELGKYKFLSIKN